MHAAVTAVGLDRPGIVAAVSDVLFRQGANIEDSRMAILGGHFSMMLVVALPEGTDPRELEDALGATAAELDLIVTARALGETTPDRKDGDDFIVRVYGADRPGIVARVTRTLADHGVNIRDLATHVVEGEPAVYVMLLEVTVPEGTDATILDTELQRIASDLDVEISLQPMEAETL